MKIPSASLPRAILCVCCWLTSAAIAFPQTATPAVPLTPAKAATKPVDHPSQVAASDEEGLPDGDATSEEADADNKDGDQPAKELTEEEKKQAAEAKKKAAEEKRKKEEQEKLAKIKQLTFDRRPSAMLKAWSTPPEPEKDVDEADEGEATEEPDEGEDASAVTAEVPAATAVSVPSTIIVRTPQAPQIVSFSAGNVVLPEGVSFPPGAQIPGAVATTTEPGKKKKEDKFDRELKRFQRAVTLGDWEFVQQTIAGLSEKLGKALYEQLLTSLGQQAPIQIEQIEELTGVFGQQQRQMVQNALRNSRNAGQRYAEKNTISLQDVVALIEAAPLELDRPTLDRIAVLLRMSLSSGNVLEEFLIAVRERGDDLLTKKQTARLLSSCQQRIEMGEFLPGVEEAAADDDRESLNLLSQHYLALYSRDKKITQLEDAWKVTQAALAATSKTDQEQTDDQRKADRQEKETALQRAVDLAPKIREEFGQRWLDESFTQHPERGKEILATIGTATATRLSQRPHDTDARLKGLQLQKTAVDALLEFAPEKAREWRESLNLLAFNWLQEAQVTYQYGQSTGMGSNIRRDMYGNIYYVNGDDPYAGYNPRRNGNAPRPVEIREILDTRPAGLWLDLVEDSIQPKYDMMFSQLYLKASDEAKAFPYIEKLSTTYPEKSKELAHEFLRVWTKNHNPNEAKERTNHYMFMYGYERKADRIPLTRSKQQRNLQELAGWVARLKALPFGELDEQLLVRAFTTSHSSAEVYRLEAIESVFGSLNHLKPQTLAEMIQQMRVNLAGVWRKADVQKQNGTKRKKQDIQLEVKRGYSVARSVLESGLEKFPGTWQLTLAKAAILHDENDYQQEVKKSSEFSARRQAALEQFAVAARQYAEAIPDLPEDEQSTRVFDQWFYASLGACDLGRVNQDSVPDLKQITKIRAAIAALPGETSQSHVDKFANALFTRMSSVNPACKFRYLTGGFEIVGDHKQAYEARQVFDYYHDLVTEIQLDVDIDGTDVVGHEEPFGVYINVRHTKEIERESGGFAKYLQNQNNSYWSFNYGRPTENYRDKFQESVTKALEEHFDVLAITFNHAETKSYAVKPYGWRVTPYAHLLLRARGPEIDKLPPLQLDLDFLDTSGYVVLPIQSATVPLDAAGRETRPYEDLKIVQTLDERQADDGKLILELKANAHGLVPPLEEIVDIRSQGLQVAEIDDQGVTVTEFDKESEHVEVLSERVWTVTMQAGEDIRARPTEFAFAGPRDDAFEMTYQRYEDADLVEVEPTISLAKKYGTPKQYPLLTSLVCLGLIGGSFWTLRVLNQSKPEKQPLRAYEMPERLTPFTVISLLKQMQRSNGIPEPEMERLTHCIHRLEHHYFVDPDDTEPDLEAITHEWIGKSDRSRNGSAI